LRLFLFPGCNSFAIFRNASSEDRLVFGSPSQPKIYTLSQNFSDNGFGYTRTLKTKKYHFGQPHQIKHYQWIDISGLLALSTKLDVTIFVDDAPYQLTLDKDNVNFLQEPSTEGYFGEDYIGDTYFGGTGEDVEVPLFPFVKRIYIHQDYRRGRTIQVQFKNDGNNQGWAIDFPYFTCKWEPFAETAET